MPEIPLLDRAGKPLSGLDTYFTLQAIMLSPNEDVISTYLHSTAGGLTDLFKKMFLMFSKADTGGTVAGMVFIRLLQLKLHLPEHASLGKAVFLVSTALKQTSKADGIRIPTGRGYVEDFWFKFRPAAHLWGAACQLSESGIELGEDPTQFAQALIYFADEMFKAAMAKELDLGPDPWKLPDAYPRLSLDYRTQPPKPEIVELLGKYKAAGRRS